MLVRPIFARGGLMADKLAPGDLLASGRSLQPLTTAGNGTLTGALFAAGIITRTGPAGVYSDTTDTAWNIIQALAGNSPAVDQEPGVTFELTIQNGVAFALTMLAGAGVTLGANTAIAASLVRDYLVTLLNTTAPVTLSCGTTNGNKVITFDNQVQMGTFDNTQNRGYGTVTPGMVISGAGITAGTKVVGLTFGAQNYLTGVTTDTNSTATAATGVLLSFLPNVRIDGLRSATA